MKQLHKPEVAQEGTNVSTPTAACQASGVYDEIPDGYDEIHSYADLKNKGDNVSGPPALSYEHLNERPTAYARPYDKLIHQQLDKMSAGSAEHQEKLDPLLIEPQAEFRDARKIKTPLPYIEEGAICAPTSPSLYAQLNKKIYENLDEIELANQSGPSPAVYTRKTAVNRAKKTHVGLKTEQRKYSSSVMRGDTS